MPTSDEILTLAIETSNPSLVGAHEPGTPPAEPGMGPGVVVGLASTKAGDGTLARVLAWRALERAHPNEDPLAALIDACVRDAGAKPSDLRRVAVSVGPGGFTSVRVAVTTAKLIAEATGAACGGVPSALVAAWGLRHASQATKFPLAIALASKGESAWVAVYGSDLSLRGDPRVITAREVASLASEGVQTLARDGFLPPAMEVAATEAGLTCVGLELAARGVLELSASIEPVDPATLAPIYPREPEAVTKWRAMGRGPGAERR